MRKKDTEREKNIRDKIKDEPPTCSRMYRFRVPNVLCWPWTRWHQSDRLPPDLSSFLFLPQPDELEGVHTHTFKMKPFKTIKSCDICKQAITKEGFICKGESPAGGRGGTSDL